MEAAFDATAKYAVTVVGAPSYASGAHMWEWSGGDFEKQAHGRRGQRQENHGVPGRAAFNRHRDIGPASYSPRFHTSPRSHTPENRTRKAAQQEILERGFIGTLISAQESHQHVE